MIESKEILQYEQQACAIHADRISKALEEIEKLLPLTVIKIQSMNTHELAITELLTGRFSKLQDTIGEKVFPLILVNLGEDLKGKSFIDRLHVLEKLNYIDNAQQWFVYRKARNAASYEYPDHPESIVKNLEETISLAKELLTYWQILNQKIQQILALEKEI